MFYDLSRTLVYPQKADDKFEAKRRTHEALHRRQATKQEAPVNKVRQSDRTRPSELLCQCCSSTDVKLARCPRSDLDLIPEHGRFRFGKCTLWGEAI
eukprot:SAG31_NODE_11_length_38734_cov_21.263854_2_plen_97_part_00